MLPDSDKDQHGNPVATRAGSRFDPEAGWAYEVWLKELRTEFVLIPAGEFMMGTSSEDVKRLVEMLGEDDHLRWEQPQHRVRISRAFYMSKYEVTNAQFKAMRPDHANAFPKVNGPSQPAGYISWNDANEFSTWLEKRIGVHTRMPTEAEWEYACRAGTQTFYYWGDRLDPAYCNFPDKNTNLPYASADLDDGHKFSAPVGRYKPNGFGLYDMLGNVMEWTLDGRRPYGASTQTDPRGSDTNPPNVRGGSWKENMPLRAAFRGCSARSFRTLSHGFRLAIGLP